MLCARFGVLPCAFPAPAQYEPGHLRRPRHSCAASVEMIGRGDRLTGPPSLRRLALFPPFTAFAAPDEREDFRVSDSRSATATVGVPGMMPVQKTPPRRTAVCERGHEPRAHREKMDGPEGPPQC